MKCDACGAPVENGKCTYCGKVFPEDSTDATESSHQYTRPTDINVTIKHESNKRVYTRPKTAPKKPEKKRIGCGTVILIFLAFCVLVSIFSGGSDDEDDDSVTSESVSTESSDNETVSIWASDYADIEDFDYYIDGTELYLKDYNGKDKKVRIAPSYEIEGTVYNVVALKDGTFALHSVDSVIIPEGVVSVENNTFNSCGVEYVYLPSTLEEISSSFLSYFHDVEKIYYGGTEEQWNALVTRDREDIDVKQIIYEANPDELQ